MTENFDNLSIVAEVEASEELPEIIPGVKFNPNRFRMLCDNVENCFFEIDKSMFEILELKDKLLLQYLPRNVLLHITLVLSRFVRAYSQTQIPVHELIRLVQLYSQPFDMKCKVLKRLYDSNELKKRMLNLALQKLMSTEEQRKQCQEKKLIDQWEKMYVRLALPKGNVRKWKFRMQTFREKAELGYEHVIEWIHTGMARPLLPFSDGEVTDDRIRTAVEIDSTRETSELELQTDHGSHGSENQGSKPEVIKTDVEIQVQPDFDDQQTSTEDILTTKSLIMRVYRPIGIDKIKFQCIAHVQGRKYTTKMFIINKTNVRTVADNRLTKTRKPKETPPPFDINAIDKQQTDEFIIPMPNVLTRRSLFQTDIDPNTIKIDILADEKFYGSFVLSSEDLRMLDLPTLKSSNVTPLIALEENQSFDAQLDFDQPSHDLYKSWMSRTPPTFLIYNNKHQSIGKLPLLMFWYDKLESTQATKGTMTMPMESRVPTQKIEVFMPPRTEQLDSSDDQIEVIKATYENEIVRLHETYQMEIHRLTDLLNKLVSEPFDANENTPEVTQESLSSTKTRRSTKRQVSMERPFSSVYRKELPKNFLDRYQMHLQRSLEHRHQLIAKIEQETALANERQMEFQHRLYKPQQSIELDDDLCLPAVFMPFRSGNIINPRAYQFFHPIGSTGPRLTQAPSILKFPSLPTRSVSILNLFELSRSNDTMITEKEHSTLRPTTQASD